MYGAAPRRDPEAARRTRAAFMVELDEMFALPAVPVPDLRGAYPAGRRRADAFGWRTYFQPLRKRTLSFALAGVLVFAVFLFGGLGTTAYAASSSLPGDALFPVKTAAETIQVRWTPGPSARARLYLAFAGQRLEEMQALIEEGRFGHLEAAAGEFEKDIQGTLWEIESLAQHQPGEAARLRQETAAVLHDYSGDLTRMLAAVPLEARMSIQRASQTSESAAGLLEAPGGEGDDDDDDEGHLGGRGGSDDCRTHPTGNRDDDDCHVPRGERGGRLTLPSLPAAPGNESTNDSNNTSNNESNNTSNNTSNNNAGNNGGEDDDDEDDDDDDNDNDDDDD